MANNTTSKIVIALAAVLLLGAVVVFAWPPTGYNNGYMPEQPIPYSHQLHAGKLQIPCQYCHANVERSKHATVPPTNVCMNCHGNLKPGVNDKGEIVKRPWLDELRNRYDKGLSIPWVKVHMLPDFVHFNHKRHIAKGVSCQTCHGPIQEMETVYQHSDLSMGWCVNCHRKPENNAPVTCATCHY